MPYTKNPLYREIPFTTETPQEDFFIYDAVKNLYSKCENNKDKILKIRTVALLENDDGHIFIKQITNKHDPSAPPDPRHRIQVSMVYMKESVRVGSMPYPVQLFGSLQWRGRPVIFAQIVQPLSVFVAVQLNETMLRLSLKHAHRVPHTDEVDLLDHNHNI